MTLQALTLQDEVFLRRAIELARRARDDGRHPFGALIVNGHGRVVVEALNNAVRPAGDPTQHAELNACAAAAELLNEDELAMCTLYTSTEPCAMCSGAIYWTGIGRVVFALSEKNLYRYTGSNNGNPTLDLPCREVFVRGQRVTLVAGPFLEDEAGVVHEGFWE
jgi:tRNA(Arg) A34 adenosine deaminase TadA